MGTLHFIYLSPVEGVLTDAEWRNVTTNTREDMSPEERALSEGLTRQLNGEA